jgi:hypothetical protein
LRFSYRVMILWRILVSLEDFFWRLYFCMVKYLNFLNSSFALRYIFNVKWQGPRLIHPLFLFCSYLFVCTAHLLHLILFIVKKDKKIKAVENFRKTIAEFYPWAYIFKTNINIQCILHFLFGKTNCHLVTENNAMLLI